MFGASSPSETSASLGSEKSESFNLGQFISRPFNFVYVAGTIATLIFVPWPALRHTVWERLWWVVVAMLCDVILVQAIKLVCYLPRPNTTNTFCWGRRPHSGLPSGHTVPAFLLATLVAVTHPQLALPWYGAATLIAWARWRTEAHYAYQVVLSALLGLALAVPITYFLTRG